MHQLYGVVILCLFYNLRYLKVNARRFLSASDILASKALIPCPKFLTQHSVLIILSTYNQIYTQIEIIKSSNAITDNQYSYNQESESEQTIIAKSINLRRWHNPIFYTTLPNRIQRLVDNYSNAIQLHYKMI